MDQTFCTACGTALPPGAAFCGACGTRVEAEAEAPAAIAPDAGAPAPPPAPPPVEADQPPPDLAPEAPVPPPAEAPLSAEPYVPPPPPAVADPAPPPPPPPVYAAPPAAPAYSAAASAPAAAAAAPPPGAVAPGGAIDADHEALARFYIGPNADYYLAKWRQISATGKPNSWNWAAFFLSAFWLAYRKVWGAALGVVAAIFVLQLAGLFAPALFQLTGALALGVCAFIGWRGNALYRAQTDRAVAQARAMAQDRSGQTAWLQTQGGVTLPGALGLAAAFLVLWLLLMFVIAKQMGLGAARHYGSSSYSSSSSSSPGLITDEYLQGSQWAVSCYGSGAYIRLNPDKTFSSSVGSGTWSQIVGVLTLNYSTGQPSETMTLQMTGPNQFTFVEGNRTGTLNRC